MPFRISYVLQWHLLSLVYALFVTFRRSDGSNLSSGQRLYLIPFGGNMIAISKMPYIKTILKKLILYGVTHVNFSYHFWSSTTPYCHLTSLDVDRYPPRSKSEPRGNIAMSRKTDATNSLTVLGERSDLLLICAIG